MVYCISAQRQLFQIMSIYAFLYCYSVTLSRLNSINAIDVTGYLGDILGIFLGYFWNILEIFWRYFGDILRIFWGYFGDILRIFWGYFWDIFEISLGYLWDIFGIYLGHLWDIIGISLGYLWDIFGISLVYIWDIFGMSSGYLWDIFLSERTSGVPPVIFYLEVGLSQWAQVEYSCKAIGWSLNVTKLLQSQKETIGQSHKQLFTTKIVQKM